MEEPSPHYLNERRAPPAWHLSSETTELDLGDDRRLSGNLVSYQSGGAGGVSVCVHVGFQFPQLISPIPKANGGFVLLR